MGTVLLCMVYKYQTNCYDDVIHSVKMLGNNTGNMVFAGALHDQVDYVVDSSVACKDYINRKDIEVGIIPASNFLSIKTDILERICDQIINIPFPITLAGLGAQSEANATSPKEVVSLLPDERKSAMRMIAERVKSVGIRGEFTAEVLDLIGVHNYRIIGCPSFYKWKSSEDIRIMPPSDKNVCFTVNMKRRRNNKILNIGMESGATWIMQGLDEHPEIMYGCDYNEDLEVWVNRAFPMYDGDYKKVIRYIKTHGKIFLNLEEWRNYYIDNNITFSFGMRFHGNMMAMLSGVPTVWIGHDSRTRELIKTLHLPMIDYDDLESCKDIQSIIEKCDYTDMKNHYDTLLNNYIGYLDENNINHNLSKK